MSNEKGHLFQQDIQALLFFWPLSSKHLWTKFCAVLSYLKKLVANAVSCCTQLSLRIVLSLGRSLYSEGPLSKWSWRIECRYVVLWCKPKSHCFPKTSQCAVRSDMCKTTAYTTFSIITSPIPTKLAVAEQQARRWMWNSLMFVFEHL